MDNFTLIQSLKSDEIDALDLNTAQKYLEL
jgi:hypothetical protein